MKSIVLAISLFFVFAIAHAQEVKYVPLKNEAMGYSPKGFYISNVVDDRDNTSIGQMLTGGKRQEIAMQGGAAAAIKNFIQKNVIQNDAAQPIVLHITKLEVTVRKLGDGWSVELTKLFTFYAGDKKVVDFTGRGHGATDDDPAEYIEGFIRTSLENDLKKFDTWWAQNKTNVPTSSSVKVNVTLGRTTDKPNLIAYSLQRSLQIADFVGPVQEDIPELAATFSGIGMGYSGTTQNGQLVLDVTITPYFDKTNSWFKAAGKNPRVLAHEQAHFDITAIKACELANTIRSTSFTQSNYSSLLTQLQQQNAKDSNEEEARYDKETNHGTIEEMQHEWEQKIKDRVKAVGCY